jgi:hypothetical protein
VAAVGSCVADAADVSSGEAALGSALGRDDGPAVGSATGPALGSSDARSVNRSLGCGARARVGASGSGVSSG